MAAGLKISMIYDYESARDFLGHGTHMSSKAVGSSVLCANHFGYAKEKHTGMAPSAILAIYKVGFYGNNSLAAFMSYTLAGMDQAIADGVDLMSLSIGFPEKPFYENDIALGAFVAVEKGIFVACSAGNSGHDELANEAPWITTVAAGTIDRDFGGKITLGENELRFMGISTFPDNLLVSRVPFYYDNGNRSNETCQYGSLDPKNVTGPILDMASGVAATPVDFRAGHVNPNKALNPGLVYDISVEGYTTHSPKFLDSYESDYYRHYGCGVTVPGIRRDLV